MLKRIPTSFLGWKLTGRYDPPDDAVQLVSMGSFAAVVAASEAAAATAKRTAKVAALADLLRELAPDEVRPAVGFLTGVPRQGRIGVGWATLAGRDRSPAATSTLTVAAVDGALERLAATTGPGSAATRAGLLDDLFRAATETEGAFLFRLLTGELRQGALEGVMADAVAKAAGVPLAAVRR